MVFKNFVGTKSHLGLNIKGKGKSTEEKGGALQYIQQEKKS